MHDKAKLMELIAELKDETLNLRIEVNDLDEQVEALRLKRDAKDNRLKFVEDLLEKLACYHDDQIPDPLPL